MSDKGPSGNAPTALTLLCGACAFLLGLSFWGVSLVGPDLGWHLLGGEFVASHRAVPQADFINALRDSWHDYHWLFQLPLFLIFQEGGFAGLSIAFGIFSAFSFLGLFVLCRRVLPAQAAFLAFMIIYLIMQPSWVLRPQAASLVLILISQIVLEKEYRYELPILFLLAVLLSNMHVFWIFVPLLWFGYRVLPRLLGKESSSCINPTYAWGGAFLIGFAALVSPYGIFGGGSLAELLRNYAVLWDYLFLQPSIKSRIAEMSSPFALSGYIGPLLFIVILGVLRSLRAADIRAYPGRVFFFLVALVLVFSSAKYLGLFGLSLVFVFSGPSCSELFRSKSVQIVSLIFALLFGGYSTWIAVSRFPSSSELRVAVERSYPIEECAFVAQQVSTDAKNIKILTHFNSGGWCAYSAREVTDDSSVKVLVDNRTQGVPDEFYRKSFELFELKGDWVRVLAEWRYDYLVIGKKRPLAQLLSFDSTRWKVAFEGEQHAVFVKN